MYRFQRFLCPLLLLASTACATDPNLSSQSQEIASVMGGVEWSIDAPWRMEPPYGAIPITIAIADGSGQKDPETTMALKRFCGASVLQITDGEGAGTIRFQRFPAGFFHEIESHAKWPASSDAAAFHRLVRLWNGEFPDASILDVSASADWSGTLLYTPMTGATAGNDVMLQVTAVVSDTDTCPALADPPIQSSISHIGLGGLPHEHINGAQVFRQLLKVHYGQPLPRFDSRWVYGDVHYHSQGTDNEGESGLPYRPVLQAMKSIGLDFAFASEHASNGEQITDVDGIFASSLPFDVPDFIEDYLVGLINGKLDDFGGIPTETSIDALRDMSEDKFAFMLNWLNGSTGANQQVVTGPTAGGRAPQIFLGGEVDAVPEISATEKTLGYFPYGDGLKYYWSRACTDVPQAILDKISEISTFKLCEFGSNSLIDLASEGGRYLVRDVQGMGSNFFARQHFLHLPSDPTRVDAFVSSDSTWYGGAYRRLKDIIADEYTAANKGVFFLAHPVNGASGKGIERLGPDMVPYSDSQLKTAFDSPAFLGLELWNEDPHMRSGRTDRFPRITLQQYLPGIFGYDLWGKLIGWEKKDENGNYSQLHHGAKMWDRILLWGLDPAMKPQFVATGSPRKVFMAGGSDAHGDLNAHQVGAFVGTIYTNDSKIGTPRNLVNVGTSRPVTVSAQSRTAQTIGQTQVVNGLRSGNFSVTDGPIIRIAIDTNGNGVLDDSDVQMGGDHQWYGNVPLLVQWKSTPEFGPVTDVDIYLGSFGSGSAITYAPSNHAVRAPGDPQAATPKLHKTSTGAIYKVFPDGYATDITGKLSFTPGASEQYEGTRVISFGPNAYPAFKAACRPDYNCLLGDPDYQDPNCVPTETCTASNVAAPERMYVRAMLKSNSSVTQYGGTTADTWTNEQPIKRLGYSNPIWLKPAPIQPPVLAL